MNGSLRGSVSRKQEQQQGQQEKPIVHHSSSVAENVHAKLTNYQEPLSVATLPENQIKYMLQAHEISVKGKSIPRPIVSFDQCSQVLGQQLLDNLDQMGWSMATSVQRQAVPVMLTGRDAIVISPAGSGKTGAFVLPILAHCQSLSAFYRHKRRAGPYALILSPTRALCVQIENTIKRLATGIQNMRTALLVGGEPWPEQLHRLRKGVQIIIGTPGRILDMATYHPHMLRLWRIRILIMDEADILFASAMKKQVRMILNKLPDKMARQLGYFSTGISSEQAKIVHRMNSPIEIR
ncbi:P-loop containing nucleoside triphosphate hydrolase protein, partial [Phascolomyces articulosus]